MRKGAARLPAVTPEEAARLLRVTPSRIYRAIASDLLPAVRLGWQLFIDPEELRDYARQSHRRRAAWKRRHPPKGDKP